MDEDVRITEFDDGLAKAFAELNYRWIVESFSVERHDRELLDHPRENIIEPGGQIFFALVGDEVTGTVAMIPHGDTFELTKMAVSPAFQGRGLGDKLMARCVEFARERSVKTIFLETHSKLRPAIRLYQKFGFVDTPTDPNSEYARADIRMELAIDGGKS